MNLYMNFLSHSYKRSPVLSPQLQTFPLPSLQLQAFPRTSPTVFPIIARDITYLVNILLCFHLNESYYYQLQALPRTYYTYLVNILLYFHFNERYYH